MAARTIADDHSSREPNPESFRHWEAIRSRSDLCVYDFRLVIVDAEEVACDPLHFLQVNMFCEKLVCSSVSKHESAHKVVRGIVN